MVVQVQVQGVRRGGGGYKRLSRSSGFSYRVRVRCIVFSVGGVRNEVRSSHTRVC